MDIKRGDVWYVEKKNDTTGHEQWSGRPGIVISDNEINRGANTVEIVYLTTRPKQKSATHVQIFACGRSSTALCEQISTVDATRLKNKAGAITEAEMENIEKAVLASVGIKKTECGGGNAEAEFWKLKYETAMECYTRALETMK